MTRALLWKEWREQRPIVIAGLATAIVLPFVLAAVATSIGRQSDLASFSLLLPLVMWPLLGAACGASTISGEIGEETLGFLLSRPVSRLRVWLVKVVMGWLAFTVIVAASLAVMVVFSVTQGRGLFGGVPLELPPLILVGTSLLVLLFACSVFFSTFLSRAMTAAAAGLVTAIAIGALILLVWTRIGVAPTFEEELVALEVFVAAVLVLGASIGIFTAGELLSGRRVLRHALLGGGGALGLLVLVSVPFVLAKTRLDPDSAGLIDVRLTPARNALVSTAFGPGGSSPQLWLVYLDGSGIERLTGRLAGWPAVSPDGSLVAYVSMRGTLGLRAARARLEVVPIDRAAAPRTLVPDVGAILPFPEASEWVQIVWSPDGQRVAVRYGPAIHVAAVDGSSVVTKPLGRASGLPHFGRLAGWSSDGNEIVLVSPGWQRDEPTRVVAYDPQSDRVREIFSSPRHRISPPEDERVVGNKVPLLLTPGSDSNAGGEPKFELVQVDLTDGSVATLVESSCLTGFGFSSDDKTLVYAACPAEGSADDRIEIRFRDLSAGVDRAASAVSGRPWLMAVSPDLERVAIKPGFDDMSSPTVVLGLEVAATEFPAPWTPLGWTGSSGVVLAEPASLGYGYRRIAVGDAKTGDVRIVFEGSDVVETNGS